MKKILTSLFLILLLAVPVLGYAEDVAEDVAEPAKTPCTATHNLTNYKGCEDVAKDKSTEKAACCLIDKILTVGDWIFNALLVIGIIVILLAGFAFLTGGGDPDKIKKARDSLMYALIGIGIGFLAKIIVKVVASVVA